MSLLSQVFIKQFGFTMPSMNIFLYPRKGAKFVSPTSKLEAKTIISVSFSDSVFTTVSSYGK